MNDFFDMIDCDLIMFADNSSCIISADSPQNLKHKSQFILNQIKLYLNTNKNFLNIKKTVYMIFHKNLTFKLQYDDTDLLQVDNFKLLGIILDPQFSFEKQSINIVNKFNFTQNVLNKNLNLKKVPFKIKKMIFNSLVCSHIHYSSIYLPCLRKKNLNSILSKFDNTVKKFFATKNLNLNSIISDDICKFINKILNNKDPKTIFEVISKYLSIRKKNFFLLYKKPKRQLTFLYNIMSICNRNYSRHHTQ